MRARSGILPLTTLAVALITSPGAAQTPDRARLVATLDSLARAHAADTPLLRGYGMADLEWDVPMADVAVFEIGSMT